MAVLSIALCALLIPAFGGAGAGMALVSSGFAVVVTMHIFGASGGRRFSATPHVHCRDFSCGSMGG